MCFDTVNIQEDKIYDFRISTAASAKQTEDQKHHLEQRITFVIARLLSR
jgi:hypothetical protein